jgi:hypothetical protein
MTKPANPALVEALSKVKEETTAIQRQDDSALPAWMESMDKLDWKDLKPPVIATVLAKIPRRGRGGEMVFLKPVQALIFALRCYELGLSPFGNEVWFNADTNTVNITLEGKRKLAHDKGYKFGPCQFKRQIRDWPSAKQKPAGIAQDIGYTCQLPVHGWDKPTEYTAWLSEWYMPRSPVWQEKPEHMLQVRAQEKAISFATGVGASEMPGDDDIAGAEVPQVEVVESEFKPMKE